MRFRSALPLLFPLFLLSGCVSTSFTGDYVLPAGETLRGDLVATSGSVTLERGSQITGTVLLTSGALIVGEDAQVGKDVVLTSGDLALADGAVIHGDIVLANQEIGVDRDPGARVDGTITRNIVPFAVSAITQRLFVYCLLPAALLVLVVFAIGATLGRASRKTAGVPDPASGPAADAESKLLALKSLLDDGLITDADYQAKKKEILAAM